METPAETPFSTRDFLARSGLVDALSPIFVQHAVACSTDTARAALLTRCTELEQEVRTLRQRCDEHARRCAAADTLHYQLRRKYDEVVQEAAERRAAAQSWEHRATQAESELQRSAQQRRCSTFIGRTQEELIMHGLHERFPYAVVEDVHRQAHQMDIRLRLPGKLCVAIESKALNAANVKSADLVKFEHDFARLDGSVVGAVLVAKRRVDVANGRSQVVHHNLRRASARTYYVDNADMDALSLAVLLLFAEGQRAGDANAEDEVAAVNQVLGQTAQYIARQNRVIGQMRKSLSEYYSQHPVLADPVAASAVRLREACDRVETEQLIAGLSLPGAGRSTKRKLR